MTDLVSRLRQFRGAGWETTECYNGLREEAADRIEALERALREARDCVKSWGAYADPYFKEKHGLADDLAAIDAALSGTVAPTAGLVEALCDLHHSVFHLLDDSHDGPTYVPDAEEMLVVQKDDYKKVCDALDRIDELVPDFNMQHSAVRAALANHRSTNDEQA